MKRIAIITGASSGMGVCFAVQLAQESFADRQQAAKLRAEGAQRKANIIEENIPDEFWLIARRADKLEETRRLIELGAGGTEAQAAPPIVRTFPLDISGQAGARAVQRLLQTYAREQGEFTISVLVNNAGFGTYGEFAATDTAREMDMIDLNCTSLTGITGYALPYLAAGSRIINTASLASFLPLGNFAVYAATKAYVLYFTVALAAELKGRGIKVTVLCPGSVSTEFANVASRGARREVRHGLSPEKTVAHCLRRSRKGGLYAIWALKWKLTAAASRFVGRYAGAWFTYRYCKRPSN